MAKTVRTTEHFEGESRLCRIAKDDSLICVEGRLQLDAKITFALLFTGQRGMQQRLSARATFWPSEALPRGLFPVTENPLTPDGFLSNYVITATLGGVPLELLCRAKVAADGRSVNVEVDR
jgi:hypothetical protein